jgi:hypothetical protein
MLARTARTRNQRAASEDVMSIKNTLAAIKLHLPHDLPADARIRLAELGSYATPRDVVSALEKSSAKTAEQRYALVAAIVAEHRANPAPLWLSILVLGFGRMLNDLRSAVGPIGDEDRDQRVLTAFVHAVNAIPADVGRYAPVALRRATARELFAPGEAEEELVSFNEDLHTPCTPFALNEAELRIDAFWARRRAERLCPEGAPVRELPKGRRNAA